MRVELCAVVLAGGAALGGCHHGSSASRATTTVPVTGPNGARFAVVTISSPALTTAGDIPVKYTCDGDGVTLPLAWRAPAAAGVTTWELRVVDPDANDFVHWVVTGIPVEVTAVREGQEPAGGRVETAYRGPCPPKGAKAHSYVITILGRKGTAAVAVGSLTATYQRH